MPGSKIRLWYPIAFAVAFGITTTAINSQEANPKTFEMAISLPSSSMHIGDSLVVKLVTTNPTDHLIYAGQGSNGGLGVELINKKGEDIGLHAMGGLPKEQPRLLHTFKRAIQPGESWTFMVHFNPEPGYLVAGTYKLRVHRRDLGTNLEVYSNAVILTVVP